jgi:hypothetical protein
MTTMTYRKKKKYIYIYIYIYICQKKVEFQCNLLLKDEIKK